MVYLQFLQTICVCDEMEIRKNQDMILNELLQSELLQYTSYCNTDKMGIDELCLIMQKSPDLSIFADEQNDPVEIDPFVLFHVELIKVKSKRIFFNNYFF